MLTDLKSQGVQRILALAIVVLAVFGIGFGSSWIRQHIAPPQEKSVSAFRTLDEQTVAQKQELKKLDTDHDNISDYDELFIYRTSPYLEDTDSDGFSDQKEIESGNDPNCPKGKACVNDESAGLTASSTLLVPSVREGLGSSIFPPGSLVAPDLNALASKTPAEIRAALLKAGIAKELLDTADDKTLVELFQESLKEASAQKSQ